MSGEKIGDGDAFPCTNGAQGFPGMTYRQWLIGQALAGAVACREMTDPAAAAIDFADSVLDLLESERTLPNGP